MLHTIGLQGVVRLMQYRENSLIKDVSIRNKIVWLGKKDLLNQFFRGVSVWTNFYVGLIKSDWDQFTENQPNLGTLISKEFTSYDEAARPGLTFEAADDVTDANYIFAQNSSANYCVYTISTGVVDQILDGIFIAAGAAKGAAITTLWCSAAFGNDDSSPAPVTVNASDILRIQYTIRIPKA